MNRLRHWLVFGAALLALAGCGVRPSGVISGVEAPVGEVPGIRIYFVADGQPALALRGPKPSDPADTLALLAAGPDPSERAAGLTSEVPPGIAPAKVSLGTETTTVAVPVDVTKLSVLAVVQIVCTVQAGTPGPAPVTLVSDQQRRGPLTCPAY